MLLPKTEELFAPTGLENMSDEFIRWFFSNLYPWEALSRELKNKIGQMVSKVELKDRLQGNISPQASIAENVIVEEGATVEPFSFIQGPTIVKKNATIRHGAYIRGGCMIGEGAIVGHSTEVKDSILLKGAKAAHFAYVGNSILGQGCNLGAGTKLANFRFDGGNIKLKNGDEKIDSKLRKFGAIMGDFAQTGCNSVTNPGTIFLPSTFLKPNSTAIGLISSRLPSM